MSFIPGVPLNVSIIGTAGRKDDESLLSTNAVTKWNKMVKNVENILRSYDETFLNFSLVSGGAAWADHIAVELSNSRNIPIQIYFPYDKNNQIQSRYYHKKFSLFRKKDIDFTWNEMMSKPIEYIGTFFDRNREVAKHCDVMIALTFGTQEKAIEKYSGEVKAKESGLKDGGTAYTWDKTPDYIEKWHINLNRIL